MAKYVITCDAQAYGIAEDYKEATSLVMNALASFDPIKVEKFRPLGSRFIVGDWHVFSDTGYHLVEVTRS